MKRILFVCLTLCFSMLLLSCSRDSEDSPKNYVGKWFFYKYTITENGNTTTHTPNNCDTKTNVQINIDNSVVHESYSNCTTYKTYYGSYDNNAKKMTIQYDNSNTIFDVEFSNSDMLLKQTQTISGATYTSIAYCKKN